MGCVLQRRIHYPGSSSASRRKSQITLWGGPGAAVQHAPTRRFVTAAALPIVPSFGGGLDRRVHAFRRLTRRRPAMFRAPAATGIAIRRPRRQNGHVTRSSRSRTSPSAIQQPDPLASVGSSGAAASWLGLTRRATRELPARVGGPIGVLFLAETPVAVGPSDPASQASARLGFGRGGRSRVHRMRTRRCGNRSGALSTRCNRGPAAPPLYPTRRVAGPRPTVPRTGTRGARPPASRRLPGFGWAGAAASVPFCESRWRG